MLDALSPYMSRRTRPSRSRQPGRELAERNSTAWSTLRQLYSLGYSEQSGKDACQRPAGSIPVHRGRLCCRPLNKSAGKASGWLQFWPAEKAPRLATRARGSFGNFGEAREGRSTSTIPRRRGGRPRRGHSPSSPRNAVSRRGHDAHGRIPVTSPARTILDLATTLPRRQLERAIDEADRLNICTEGDLEEIARVALWTRGCRDLGRPHPRAPRRVNGHTQRLRGEIPRPLSGPPPSPAGSERAAARLRRGFPLAPMRSSSSSWTAARHTGRGAPSRRTATAMAASPSRATASCASPGGT